MRIIIINGNPDEQHPVFDEYLDRYQQHLSHAGHIVKTITLREMSLGFCRGCFKCWHTTPGICIINDDIRIIHREVIQSDLVVWASPLIKGYFSSLLKRVQERMIPLLHPYAEVVSGEIHHRKRYLHYPDYGVIVDREPDTDEEDLLIMKSIQERYALNFRSSLNFSFTTALSAREAAAETISHPRTVRLHTGDVGDDALPALVLYNSSMN